MVNNVNSNLISTLLSGSSSTQNLSSIKKALESTTTTNSSDLVDQGSISDEALQKYQTEQEISYYKNILSAMFGDETPTDQVSSLLNQVKTGDYSVDTASLSDAMTNDEYLQALLGNTTSTASSTGTTAITAASSTADAYAEINQLLSDTLENIM